MLYKVQHVNCSICLLCNNSLNYNLLLIKDCVSQSQPCQILLGLTVSTQSILYLLLMMNQKDRNSFKFQFGSCFSLRKQNIVRLQKSFDEHNTSILNQNTTILLSSGDKNCNQAKYQIVFKQIPTLLSSTRIISFSSQYISPKTLASSGVSPS